MVCCFMSCQAKKDNVVLTDFTKELISLYIDTYIDEIERTLQYRNINDIKPEIIVSTYTDTLNYYLIIHYNTERRYYDCLRDDDDFIGQTTYRGFRVRVFGEKESIFYSVERNIKRRRGKCNYIIFYNPPTWIFALHKDLSFCEIKTSKEREDDDISILRDLAEKYFIVSDCPSWCELPNPY